MGTRAVYFFKDHSDESLYGVYKHYDGYPHGAAHHIEAAKAYAWPLPRYEADEFAAAFVAANKNPKGGEVRLLPHFEDTSIPMMMDTLGWCDYYYVISWGVEVKELVVEIFERFYDYDEAYEMPETVWKKIGEMTHQRMLRAYAESDSWAS